MESAYIWHAQSTELHRLEAALIRRLVFECLLKLVRKGVELCHKAVDGSMDSLHWPRVVGLCLHFDLDGRLKRVGHPIPSKCHVPILQKLPAKALE